MRADSATRPVGARWASVVAALLTMVVAVSGCGGPAPRPADRDAALAALRTALEAWQKGDPPDSLRQRQPPIVMVDPAWGQGTKLARFAIETDLAQPSGYDLGCPVRLWLGDGRKEPRRVKFTVATSPQLVVTRDFGG